MPGSAAKTAVAVQNRPAKPTHVARNAFRMVSLPWERSPLLPKRRVHLFESKAHGGSLLSLVRRSPVLAGIYPNGLKLSPRHGRKSSRGSNPGGGRAVSDADCH